MPRRHPPSLRHVLAVGVFVALFGGVSPLSFAASSHQPVITEVRAEPGVLRVIGSDLARGTPRVTLGGFPLTVALATDRQLDVVLPAGVLPGTYLLALTVGSGDDKKDDGKYDESWVTIGAVGPHGERGLPGEPGAMGATGLAGPMGPTGPQGAVGATGPMGPTGATGAAGPSGANGAMGPAGPQGPQGVAGPAGTAGAVTATSTYAVSGRNVVAADAGQTIIVTTPCPPGTILTGGGVVTYGVWFGDVPGWPANNAWNAAGRAHPEGYTTGSSLTAWAVCLRLA